MAHAPKSITSISETQVVMVMAGCALIREATEEIEKVSKLLLEEQENTELWKALKIQQGRLKTRSTNTFRMITQLMGDTGR